MKREFGRGRKILENGISPIDPFTAKAGPTECTQSECGTGFSREEAGLSAAQSWYEVYG
jgi:hypothetical protein